MELPAMAMLVATVLLASGVLTEEGGSGAAAPCSQHKRERPCPWTLRRCSRAPRGWQLFQLVSPWLIVLVLCMPCLGVAGQSTLTMDVGCLQPSFQLSADGVMVHDQEARPVTCAVTDDSKDSVADESGSFRKKRPSATGFGVDNVELLGSTEAETFPDSPAFVAKDELVVASCMLPSWTYVQQALLSTILRAETSAEILVQSSSVQQQSVAASVDWGTNSLISVSVKVLTLMNRQNSTELKVFKIFTTNTQFCALDFREAVISPGSKLSIPVAYIPNIIGKAEGRMLLQTNAGWYIVETLGEGVLSQYKLHPLPTSVADSKAEWQETISLFNPFNEPISVKEAYVWEESIGDVSTFYQSRGEGISCKSYDFKPRSSNPSSLKVRPTVVVEWVIAPHSSSPIMDLTIVVDDGERLVGTLCLKIYRHSVQLFEVLVVPVEMERVSTGTSGTKSFAKEVLVEAGVFLEAEQQNGWALFVMNSDFVQVQVREASAKGHNDIIPITIPIENSVLSFGVKMLAPDMALICFSHKIFLGCKSCCMADFFILNMLIIFINSTIHPAVPALCSAVLLYGANTDADVDERRCLATLIECTEDVSHQKCFEMPSALCKAYAVVDGLVNNNIVHGPKFIHGHDPDCSHIAWEYHIGVLPVAAQNKLWSNVSNLRLKYEKWKVKKNTCILALSLDHLAEVMKLKSKQGNPFNLLSPFFLCSKSGCACPSLVLVSSSYTWLDCKLTDSSVSVVLRAWIENNSRLHMGSFKQHNHQLSRGLDTNILYQMQDSNLIDVQEFGCKAIKKMGPVNIGNCGSELFFCYKEQSNLRKSNFIEGSVAHCVPLEAYVADLSHPVCRVSLPFSRHQKLVLKVSLLILFSVLVVLIKLLRQEKQLATDVRLRHSCSHTFFLQSVCLKTSYIRASERSSSYKNALQRLNTASSLECQDDECYENKLLIVMARVVGSLGSMLQWFFGSQATVATVLNVRVHIAESPCAASVEQVPSYTRNSLIADDKNYRVGLNSVEKPVSCQSSTTVQGIQGSGCRDRTDTSSLKHFEANTSVSVSPATMHSTTEDVLQRPSSTRSLIDLEKVNQKEKRNKGKRRKRRSNIIDLKQESERMGQSGSSSPPSSPASPATPLAYSHISPFLRSDSPSRSLKSSAHSSGPRINSFRDSTRRSPFIQFSSEMLSQLDVRGDHAYFPASKGKSHNLRSLGPKAGLESLSMRRPAAVKSEFSEKCSVRKDSTEDASAGENWAAVARRAIGTTSEPDRWQGLPSSSRCSKNGGSQIRPVLLPSATFPQSGQSMQWNPQMLEERRIILNDPMASPSLVSISLVAPNARAPGSKPAINGNEKLPVNNLLKAAVGQSQMGSTDMSIDQSGHKGLNNDDHLYDIWGNHFAEISCSTQINAFSSDPKPEYDMVGMTSPAFPKDGRLFASSDFMISTSVSGSADASASHSISTPSEGFSIFSHDAFFSPYQHKDAAGSSTA